MELPSGVHEGIVKSLPDEVAVLDAGGTIVFTNDAWRQFAVENDIAGGPGTVGVNYLDVVRDAGEDEHAGAVLRELRALLDGDRSTFSLEYPCHSPTGERWFSMSGRTVTNRGERYVVLLHAEITERTLAMRELERRNDRLETVAAVLSHDLRNPLNVATLYLEILSEEGGDTEIVRKVRAALDRMTAIIDDALRLAHAGDIDDTEPVDLRSRARAAWRSVDTRGATLDVVGDRRFEADPGLLSNLFENLFRNAVEHAGPDVAVTVGPLDDGAGFYVADDGPGIPPDERERAFETGFTTRTGGGNIGFGLTIVEDVATSHGWTVRLTDASTGGARFEFRGVTE